ncbi:hypothetical protein GGR23_000039 [Gellertiella hungarica]|uniref:Uncharacterized protein n=1 Tax=Gellertiella hungarica TaxID=1572859 RepID=A0A7W6J169_9HYPH|nr:hypothetical protein [Gellertiella hungarica]
MAVSLALRVAMGAILAEHRPPAKDGHAKFYKNHRK